MAIDIQKFIGRFIEEARDHLSRLGDGLAQLQARPEAAHEGDTIHALFRSAHTIKGSSRMLRLAPITELAHAMEDVLGALREGSLTFNAPLGALLYQGVDHLASQVDALAEGTAGADLPAVPAALHAALQAAVQTEKTIAPSAEPASISEQKPSENKDIVQAYGLTIQYFANNEKIIIIDQAKVIQQGNTFRGEKIIYDTQKQIVTAGRGKQGTISTP